MKLIKLLLFLLIALPFLLAWICQIVGVEKEQTKHRKSTDGNKSTEVEKK